MLIKSSISHADNVKFGIDYCETGSSFEIQNEVGVPMFTLACIPPAMLVRLRDELTAEIDKGARLSPLSSQRRRVQDKPKSE